MPIGTRVPPQRSSRGHRPCAGIPGGRAAGRHSAVARSAAGRTAAARDQDRSARTHPMALATHLAAYHSRVVSRRPRPRGVRRGRRLQRHGGAGADLHDHDRGAHRERRRGRERRDEEAAGPGKAELGSRDFDAHARRQPPAGYGGVGREAAVVRLQPRAHAVARRDTALRRKIRTPGRAGAGTDLGAALLLRQCSRGVSYVRHLRPGFGMPNGRTVASHDGIP
jgi:hypothetical protein